MEAAASATSVVTLIEVTSVGLHWRPVRTFFRSVPDDGIDVFLCDGHHTRASHFISAEERAKVTKLDVNVARQFLAARANLRLILSHVTGICAEEIPIRIGKNGRPTVGHDPALDFNLSHSGGSILIAVSRRGRVGVDIQATDVDLPDGIEQLVLTRDERRTTTAALFR